MGHGYRLICPKCGFQKDVSLGMSFFATSLCAQLDPNAPAKHLVSATRTGVTHTVVRTKTYRCGKCKHTMRPTTNKEKIKCPTCGESLSHGGMIMWD